MLWPACRADHSVQIRPEQSRRFQEEVFCAGVSDSPTLGPPVTGLGLDAQSAISYEPNYMNIRAMRIAFFSGAYNHIADGVSLTLNRLVHFLLENDAQVHVYAPTAESPALKHAGTLIPVPSVAAPGRPDYRVSTGLGGDARSDLT